MSKLINKIAADVLCYYEQRGKSEIASFVQSMLAGFGFLFTLLTFTDLSGLFMGSVEKDLTSLGLAFLYALARSLLGGFGFAIVRRLAPPKWRDKIDALLLRTPDGK